LLALTTELRDKNAVLQAEKALFSSKARDLELQLENAKSQMTQLNKTVETVIAQKKYLKNIRK
jgi:primosomal protein N''